MKRLLIVTAAMATLSGAAFAEGNGGGTANLPGKEALLAAPPSLDVGSNQYPSHDGTVGGLRNYAAVPVTGAESGVDSAVTLPVRSDRISSGQREYTEVVTGHVVANNGSGIQNTANSLPVGASDGMPAQIGSTSMSAWVAADQKRQMSAPQEDRSRNASNAGSISSPHG